MLEKEQMFFTKNLKMKSKGGEKIFLISHRKLFKFNLIQTNMEKASNYNIEIERIKKERDSWKETALVAGDSEIMKSIELSLKQISSGKAIPLAQL